MVSGEDLDRTPTPNEEASEVFLNTDNQEKHLENQRIRDVNQIRLEYVKSAKGLAETWIGFSIVMSVAQFVRPSDMQLSDPAFVAIIATALGSVIALWAIVGRGVFGDRAAEPYLPSTPFAHCLARLTMVRASSRGARRGKVRGAPLRRVS
jgi:hypothetical protein